MRVGPRLHLQGWWSVGAQHQPGTLYLVATPIGNLRDLSERAVATLGAVDLVVAEDTRRAQKLLSHLGLHKPLESYHGDSDTRKEERLLRALTGGQSIAYVSDGGTPTVADPGRELVRAAAQVGVSVVAIPGPCALVTALTVSGMVADRFVFAGFPPRKAGERLEFLRHHVGLGLTVVLYEAPHRIRDTMRALAEVCPERAACVARELTKHYEELKRGTAAELADAMADCTPQGEFVVVIEGGEAVPTVSALPDVAPVVRRLLQEGLRPKAVAGMLAELGVASRNEAYALVMRMKEEAVGEEK